MGNKHAITASVVALLAATGTAFAADLYTPVPATPTYTPTPVYTAPAAYDWTGPYAGALLGYGWGTLTGGTAPDTLSGFMAGAFVGYNVQSGSAVFGAEMDAQWSGMDGTDPVNEVNWTSSFRGRIGYALDRFLPYVTGGVALAGVSTNTGAVPPTTTTEFGWTVGAGVDIAVTDTVFGRIQYNYSNYGAVGTTGSSLTTQEVSAGIGVRF